MNSIILIDDDSQFIKSFTNDAFARGITVAPKNSLEGLKQLLPGFAHKYAAVVLDIKCLLESNQAKEDASFITAALKYLDSTIPRFPRFILTGDESEFDTLKRYYTDEKMFVKQPDDQKKLLDELFHCVTNAELLKVRREYYAVFEIFELRKMNDAAEQLLIEIITKGTDEKDYRQFRGILANVRSMQETIYKSINLRNTSVIPNNMFRTNGMIKFNDLMRHLCGGTIPPAPPNGAVYQTSTIYQLASSLYWSCGEYIHEDPNRTYFISEYTVKSLINNLLELIIWAKQY